jgi:hypothetical protein
MTARERIRVVLTSSRIKKGLLAISRKFQPLFPSVAQKITVFFDDAVTPHQKPYTPYESTTRECRIYSLRRWFRKHRASEGDWVEIVKEAAGYRLIFRSREEIRFQRELQAAKTENQAEEALRRLAHRRRLSQRATALKELARLAQQIQRRKRIPVAPRERHEGVPVSLRMLLKMVYRGTLPDLWLHFPQERTASRILRCTMLIPTQGTIPKICWCFAPTAMPRWNTLRLP